MIWNGIDRKCATDYVTIYGLAMAMVFSLTER